jgi:hypothetical protein
MEFSFIIRVFYYRISSSEIPVALLVANLCLNFIPFFSMIGVVLSLAGRFIYRFRKRFFEKRFSEKIFYSTYDYFFVPIIGTLTFSYTLGIISSLNFIIINHLLYQYLHNSQVSFLLTVCAHAFYYFSSQILCLVIHY